MTTTRAWRRRLILAAACLLLGAVTTVGVALASALRHRGPPETWPTHVHGGISGAGQLWYIHFAESSDATFVSIDVQRLVVPGLSSEAFSDPSEHSPLTFRRALEQTAANTPISDFSQTPAMRWGSVPWAITPEPPESNWATNVFLNHAYGWPSRTLWYMVGAEDAMGAGQIDVENGALSTRWGVVPVNVRLRGLVINTLFYAAPWWILLVTPGAINRWRRKRRGLCIACGYDLRGLAAGHPCPECGRGEQGGLAQEGRVGTACRGVPRASRGAGLHSPSATCPTLSPHAPDHRRTRENRRGAAQSSAA